MNEVVKYENRVNSLGLSGFSAVELNLFMLLCSKTKNKGQELIELDYGNLKKLLGLEKQSDKYLHEELYKMSSKMTKINGNFKNDKKFVAFNLFSTFSGDLEEKKLTVRVNIDFEFLLNEITKNFTRFELSEFVKLESKYSKNLYRLLKQYRKTGTYRVEAEKFRELMDCPKSYTNKFFMRDCVNVAVKELSRGYFDDLKVTPIKAPKRGAPIVAYEFTFKPTKNIPGQYSLDDYNEEEEPKKPRKRSGKNAKNCFNNFHQREYDYDALEKGLLQNDHAEKGEENDSTGKTE